MLTSSNCFGLINLLKEKNIDLLLQRIIERKNRLDSFRPLLLELVKNLEKWYALELTYPSNAPEANTLSRSEDAFTAMLDFAAADQVFRI